MHQRDNRRRLCVCGVGPIPQGRGTPGGGGGGVAQAASGLQIQGGEWQCVTVGGWVGCVSCVYMDSNAYLSDLFYTLSTVYTIYTLTMPACPHALSLPTLSLSSLCHTYALPMPVLSSVTYTGGGEDLHQG